MKRKLFVIAAALSALLCAGTVVLWVRSFRGDSHVGFDARGVRYTIESTWPRLVLRGPPGDGSDDPTAAEIASRMSGDDLDWGPPIEQREGWRVRGDVRRGTATWEMFQCYRDRLGDRAGMEPATRVWLKSLDNPRAFVPAHMLLSLWFDRWRDATIWEGVPAVYVPVLPGTTRPLLDRRAALRDEWYDRLATPRVSVFYGWLAAATLVLPLAWLARPRRAIKRRERLALAWAFNAASVVSLVLSVAGATAWVRSYWVADCWLFAPRPLNTSFRWSFGSEPLGLSSSLRSSAGRVEGHEVVGPGFRAMSRLQYWSGAPGPLTKGWLSLPEVTGDRHWRVPGVEYDSRRLQEIKVPLTTAPIPLSRWQTSTATALGPASPFGPTTTATTRTTMTTAPPTPAQPLPASTTSPSAVPVPTWSIGGPMLVGGQRLLIVSWWLPVLCGAILPALWARGAWARHRDARRAGRDLCRSCGYDLRATPERCPECGTVPTKPWNHRKDLADMA